LRQEKAWSTWIRKCIDDAERRDRVVWEGEFARLIAMDANAREAEKARAKVLATFERFGLSAPASTPTASARR